MKTYPIVDLVNKILRSHLKFWEPKVTTILEIKHIKILPLGHLIGSRHIHEKTIGVDQSK